MPYSNKKITRTNESAVSTVSSIEGASLLSKKKEKHTSFAQKCLICAIFLFALFCALPVLLIIIAAFSSEASISEKGFSFFPSGWSLKAFEYVGNFSDQIVQSYKISILVTISGTLLTLFLTGMFAYALSRKDFALKGPLSIFLLITMLFNGGLLGSYLINTNVFNLRNNLLVLIVPSCISAWNCIIMRTFMQLNVPSSLLDAAKIDGAGETRTYFEIVLPILVPVMSAIGFMTAVGHWNDWQTAFLYIDDPQITPLQLMLIRIEKSLSYLQRRMSELSPEEMQRLKDAPNESARMATLLCTLGPILVAYPFFQKYFIKGITVGAVKG